MTSDTRFERTLAAWLEHEGQRRVPDHLAEVLGRTVATRQRRWWSSPWRFLPVTATTLTGRTSTVPGFAWLLLAVAVLLGVLAFTLLAGGPTPQRDPFGLARNGRILVAEGATLVSYEADGTGRRDLAEIRGGTPSLAVSPDGSRVAMPRDDGREPWVQLLSLVGRPAVAIRPEGATAIGALPVGWSPDSRTVVFAARIGGVDRLVRAAADGSAVDVLTQVTVADAPAIWQPAFTPDGAWISFAASRAEGPADTAPIDDGRLYRVHPDGTGLELVPTGDLQVNWNGWPPVWAPDPAVHRLLYARPDGYAGLLDLDTGTRITLDGIGATWSPDGRRIGYWTDGPVIVSTEDLLAGRATPIPVFARVDDNCVPADATQIAACSPIDWSPDGTLVLSMSAGDELVFAAADGSGAARSVASGGTVTATAWQRLAP